MAKKYIIGIDEVGRGPIAGPVTVCSLVLKPSFNRRGFLKSKKFKDSKKLSHSERLIWLEKINHEKAKDNLDYKVCFESNKIIDTKGLTLAINRALEKSIKSLKLDPKDTIVLLDGGLKAPARFKNQKTIIKGDEKELVIAMASIVAKETRDDFMIKLDKKYPGYGLSKHKGYGTTSHYQALKKLGISPIHRQLFLRRFKALDKKGKIG